MTDPYESELVRYRGAGDGNDGVGSAEHGNSTVEGSWKKGGGEKRMGEEG